MEQFWTYFKLGFAHIIDWGRYEYLLFLLVLVVAFSIYEWKRILWLVTLFSISTILTRILCVYDVISIDNSLVGFLVPVTIMITACYTIFVGGKKIKQQKVNLLFFTSIFFGIVQGLRFSTGFDQIFNRSENKWLALLEFGLGIEAAQITGALVILFLGFFFDSVLRFSKRDWILVISSIVIGLTIPILSQNWLW